MLLEYPVNSLARRIHRTPSTLPSRRVLLLTALFTVLIPSAVYALTTFGPILGPTFVQPGYQWTAEVTAMTPPDHTVCLQYTATPPGGTVVLECSCVLPNCNPATDIGTWVCTIPMNIPNATIAWQIGGWAAGGGQSCGSQRTPGASGSFSTGPTAVNFASLSALPAEGKIGGWLLGLLAVVSLVAWRSQGEALIARDEPDADSDR